jgi:integrase
MVTLQRGGEICGFHRSELDWTAKKWTISGERTKNHLTHVVPLSNSALAIIDRAFTLSDSYFAFPSRKRGVEKAITRHAFSRASKRLTSALGIEDATPHDLRRTGSTHITSERIGMPRFIVSRVLNQISDTGGAATVTGIYDRNEYLREKRRALDAWAEELAGIVADG